MEIHPFAAAQATRLLERLAFQVNAAVHSHGADAVHDLRVAIRRFTQALTVFKPWIAPAERKKMRRRLKGIMALAGEVRDGDIALQMLSGWRAEGVASLEEGVRGRRKSAEKLLLSALRHWAARKSVSKWRHALEAGVVPQRSPQTPVEDVAGRELRRLAKRFFREGDRAAGPDATAGELHDFRLRPKPSATAWNCLPGFTGRWPAIGWNR